MPKKIRPLDAGLRDPDQSQNAPNSGAVVLPFSRDRRKRRRLPAPRLILLVIDLRRLLTLTRLTSDALSLDIIKSGRKFDDEYACIVGYGSRRKILESLNCQTARNRRLRDAIGNCFWQARDLRRPIHTYLFLDGEDRPHVQDLIDRLQVWRRKYQQSEDELSRLFKKRP